MISRPLILAVAQGALLSPFCAAETSAPPPPPPANERADSSRLRPETTFFLSKLLETDEARLSRMRLAIERVEKMTPAERLALRERIRNLRTASPAEHDALTAELREKFGELLRPGKPGRPEERERHHEEDERRGAGNPERPNLLQKHFASLPPEQAKMEKERFLALGREEKIAYLKALRAKHQCAEKAPIDDDAKTEPASDKNKKATAPAEK